MHRRTSYQRKRQPNDPNLVAKRRADHAVWREHWSAVAAGAPLSPLPVADCRLAQDLRRRSLDRPRRTQRAGAEGILERAAVAIPDKGKPPIAYDWYPLFFLDVPARASESSLDTRITTKWRARPSWRVSNLRIMRVCFAGELIIQPRGQAPQLARAQRQARRMARRRVDGDLRLGVERIFEISYAKAVANGRALRIV